MKQPAKSPGKSGNALSISALLDPQAWAYFAHAYRRHKLRLLFYGLLASAQSVLVLPVLFLIRAIFDKAIPNGDVRLIILCAIGIFLSRLVSSLFALVMRKLILRSIKSAVGDMRQDLIIKLYALSREFHSQASIQDMHTQVVVDTERVDSMSNALFSGILPSAITGVILFSVLLFLQWQLTLIAATIFPLLFATTMLSGRYVKRNVFEFQRAFEAFSRGMMFVIRQMDLTRIQGYENEEMDRQRSNINSLRQRSENMAFSHAVHRQVQTNVFGLAGLIILVVGGIAIAGGSLTIGSFFAFYMAAGILNGQVSSIVGGIPDIITGNESLLTLSHLVEDQDLEPYTGTRDIECQGNIELQHVSFSYDEDKPVLRDVSLTLTPQSNIVIVGPNGAGKSTIVSLILGFWRPTSGTLTSENVALDDIDIRTHRRSIGVVMQHPNLIAGTVRENITYGYGEVSEDAVITAAKAALAHDFIEKLPNGYDQIIGEDGGLISGGERQKIAIARVLLGKPKLVIFDEPTNHLDAASIKALMQSLYGSEDRPALLTISHDENVRAFGDDIYKLEDGHLTHLSSGSSTNEIADTKLSQGTV